MTTSTATTKPLVIADLQLVIHPFVYGFPLCLGTDAGPMQLLVRVFL